MRKYYIPGIISLILLPLLCTWFVKKELIKRTAYTIQVNTPNANGRYGLEFIRHVACFKYPVKFTITDDSIECMRVLKQFNQQVSALSSKSDTTQELHMVFSGTAKYWSYVCAYDICNQYPGLTYGMIEDSLWVFNMKPKKNIEPKQVMCGISYIRNREFESEQEENIKESEEIAYLKIARSLWPSAIIYVILGLLIVFSFVERTPD